MQIQLIRDFNELFRDSETVFETFSAQMNALVEDLAQAAAKGAQSASQSIQEVASLASQTSEQSMALAESFKKLKTVAQELL